MRVVLQRVSQASVEVENNIVGQIPEGFLLYVGIKQGDTEQDVDWVVDKICNLRVFPKQGGSDSFLEASLVDIGGSVLVVSQFTLYGEVKKGTRPSFSDAARPGEAEQLYEYMIRSFLERQIHTETGKFGAHMRVQSINDGPVTLLIDSPYS